MGTNAIEMAFGFLDRHRTLLVLDPLEECTKVKEMVVSLLSRSRVAAYVLAHFCDLAIPAHLAFPPAKFFYSLCITCCTLSAICRIN